MLKFVSTRRAKNKQKEPPKPRTIKVLPEHQCHLVGDSGRTRSGHAVPVPSATVRGYHPYNGGPRQVINGARNKDILDYSRNGLPLGVRGQRSGGHVTDYRNGMYITEDVYPYIPQQTGVISSQNGSAFVPVVTRPDTGKKHTLIQTHMDMEPAHISVSQEPVHAPDYDYIADAPLPPKRPLGLKPPVSPHKGRPHVHVGRGTHVHGMCDRRTPPRPGSGEPISPQSSLQRKSPSHRAGHQLRDYRHVTWDPGIINHSSSPKQEKYAAGHGRVQGQNFMFRSEIPTSEVDKVLENTNKYRYREKGPYSQNIPRFPISDADLAESRHLSTPRTPAAYQPNSVSVSHRPSQVHTSTISEGPANFERGPVRVTECVSRITESPARTYGFQHPVHGHPSIQFGQFCIDQDFSKSTYTATPSVVSNLSLQPTYSSVQNGDVVDFGRTSRPVAMTTAAHPHVAHFLSRHQQPGQMAPKGSQFVHQSSEEHSIDQDIPVTFDTFVTFGRPSPSSVTFDTFATLGRPDATSTPVSTMPHVVQRLHPQLVPEEEADNYDNVFEKVKAHDQGHMTRHVTSSFPTEPFVRERVADGPVFHSREQTYLASHAPVYSQRWIPTFSVARIPTHMTTHVTESLVTSQVDHLPTSVTYLHGSPHIATHILGQHVTQPPHDVWSSKGQGQVDAPYDYVTERSWAGIGRNEPISVTRMPIVSHRPAGVVFSEISEQDQHFQKQTHHHQQQQAFRKGFIEIDGDIRSQELTVPQETRSEFQWDTPYDNIDTDLGLRPPFHETCRYRERDSPEDDISRELASGVVTPYAAFTPVISTRRQWRQPVQQGRQPVRRRLDQFYDEDIGGKEQVMTSCVPQLNHDLKNDTLNRSYPRVQPVPGSSHQGTMSNLHDMIVRTQEPRDGDDVILDLVYITERIISMSFVSPEHETTYKQNLKEVTRMLKTKHGDHYLVLNISDKRTDLPRLCPQVKDYGWPDHLAPPLERLCSICKAIDAWLGSDPQHVVVVHCKGGRGRIAVVVAAYMRYSNICASADQALDRFAMKRYYDDKLGGLPQPSQRRYVHYFAGLLSGAIQINSNPLYLHHILIHGVPNFDTRGGCRPFIKVYQGMHCIFTSGVYNVTDNMQKVCISISPGIPLRGDILIKCYHKKNKSGQREIMWACQFHTCAISHNSLVFSKQELDEAIIDPRFPDQGKTEFIFGPNSEGLVKVADFKSDVTVPVDDSTDALVRSDSYENFVNADKDVNANGLPPGQRGGFRVTQQERNQGSVEDNLYATVNKRKLESQVIQNGPTTKMQNGSSLESAPMGSNQYSTETRRYNTKDGYNAQNYSSSYSTKSSSYSSVPRQPGKATLDEQTQLDQILSDLMSDQAFVTSPKSPKRDTTVSSETRTFKTYDEQMGPDGKMFVQRGEVTYKMPEVKEVKQEKHYTVKEERSYNKPVSAFTYTPPSPEMSRSFEPIRATSPKTHTLPHRTDYDGRTSESYSYHTMNGPRSASLSDSEQSLSWLQQQQAKLRERKEVDPSRSQHERVLMEELKSAQNKYLTKRAQSDEEERVIMDSYKKPSVLNGPVSPSSTSPGYSYTVSRHHTYSTDKSPSDFGSISPTWRQEVQTEPQMSYSTQTQNYSSSTYGPPKVAAKPPPSPQLQRAITPTSSISVSVPVPPPQRTSSKDYMSQNRARSNSGSSWQGNISQSHTTYTQARPIQRTYSESAYDREEFERQHQPRSYSSRTPPPDFTQRSLSPTQTFQTYKTIYKTIDHGKQDQMTRGTSSMTRSSPTPMVVEIPEEKPKQHYVTEVFVHRTGGDSRTGTLEREKSDTDSRLDELEKTLQAASASIVATSPWQQQHREETVTRRMETRTFETKMEQQQQQQQHAAQPAPKKITEVEEDRITLRPIGPGVQTLEPEGSQTGTLGRAITPSFPVSPVASAGGSQVTSPTGTLSESQKMQYHTVQTQQQAQQAHPQQYTIIQQAPQQYSYSQQEEQRFEKREFHTSHQQQQQQQGGGFDMVDHGLHVDTNQRQIGTSPSTPKSPPMSIGSPPSPGSLNTLRQQLNVAHSMSSSAVSPSAHSTTGQSSPSVYFGLSRRGSLTSLADSEAVHATPKFVKDTSKYWYKPSISREEAITILKDKQPGTFVVRDSNSFPGAFGLALKVATLPPNVQAKSTGDPAADLVRHFLIEPTPKGVRLRGCSNEPVFGSLASLVYQHSITPLALPCKLVLPEADPSGVVDVTVMTPDSPPSSTEVPNYAAALLAHGAACNVLYLNTVDTESLTGPQAVAKAMKVTFEMDPRPRTTVVHFKVSNQGITLTDNQRKLFFRRHYPVAAVTYCGMDPEDRKWKRDTDIPGVHADAKVFGFVARKQGGVSDNSCHLFCELDPEQPASAIVNFVTKVMIGQSKVKS